MTTTSPNRQKGVALMLALVLLLLIMAIALGVIGMSNTENAINSNYKSEETEYFAARAGVEEGRNRLYPSATDQNGNSIALTTPNLPTAPPDGGGKILYILNVPLTAANETAILTPGNALFDDELCHDIPATSPLAITHVPNNVRCTTILPASSFNFVASAGPFAAANCTSPCTPMDYKWVRIMIKENYSGPYETDTSQSALFPVCWDESSTPSTEIVTPLASNCAIAGSKPLAQPVFLVTSMAMNASGTTRRLAQEEVSLGVSYTPNYGIYSTSKACPAITFSGNGSTAGFTAVSGNEADPPASANTTSGANVGTNGGGISLSGNATIAGIAGETVNPPVCFTPDKMNQPAAATGGITPETVKVQAAPNPPPPTTSTTYSKSTTLAPGNNYGNISGSGKAVITLSIPDGQGTAANPAVYVMNSLSLSGQSSLAITPADGAACGGSAYCYVNIILAGNPSGTTALSLTGGSWGNTSGIPETLTFNVAQPTACAAAPCGSIQVSGNGGSYAVVNAPMDNVSVTGNGDIFGSLISYTTTVSGNGVLYHDTPPGNGYSLDSYLHVVAYRELSY